MDYTRFGKTNLFPSKNGAGFTLTEMMVVIAILVIIGGIVVVGWRRAQDSIELDRAAHQVAQNIHVVKDYAVQTLPDQGLCSGSEQLIGYGIYFHKNTPGSYNLFANCQNPGNGRESMGTAPLKVAQLESRVEIIDIQFFGPSGGGGGPWDGTRISFLPPEGTAQITRDHNNPSPTHSRVEITLAAKSDSSLTKIVSVADTGIVTVQ